MFCDIKRKNLFNKLYTILSIEQFYFILTNFHVQSFVLSVLYCHINNVIKNIVSFNVVCMHSQSSGYFILTLTITFSMTSNSWYKTTHKDDPKALLQVKHRCFICLAILNQLTRVRVPVSLYLTTLVNPQQQNVITSNKNIYPIPEPVPDMS